MKKIFVIMFSFMTCAAFAESDEITKDIDTEKIVELRTNIEYPDDFSNRLWVQFGINGSISFPSNSHVNKIVKEKTGEELNLNTKMVGGEFRLGYNINRWLGFWVGGIWNAYGMQDMEFIEVRSQREVFPGSGNMGLYYPSEWYGVSVEAGYNEYIAGSRIRLGDAGGLYSFLRIVTNAYWFVDIGISHQNIKVKYISNDISEIDGFSYTARKTAPYIGFGTELMISDAQAITLDASAVNFLSNFKSFSLSLLFKHYF